jgi:hypothetical protein
LIVLIVIGTINSDLYGKLTETRLLNAATAGSPTVLLVLHRMMPDQNAVETSAILILRDSGTINDIRTGRLHLSAIVRDGSGIRPYSARNEVALSPDSYQPDARVMTVESPRFFLPTEPATWTYPFDDLHVKPVVTVFRREDGANTGFSLHIQKALPGRILEIRKESGNAYINLTRPAIQKGLVVIASVIFVFLAIVVTIELFRAPKGLNDIQELLAAAGFLLTTVGFRDVLGFSRLPTTCSLEVLVIGVPIVAVSFGMVASLWRRRRHATPLDK